MSRPESRSPEPNNHDQDVMMRRKYFRQVLALGKIFYEIRKNDPQRFDVETGRILLDDLTEKNRKKGEEVELKTWLGIRDDGGLEIVSEARTYTVEGKQKSSFLSMAPREANSLASYADSLFQQKTVSRSRRKTVLIPNGNTGEVETTFSYEMFDDKNGVTALDNGPRVQQVDKGVEGNDTSSLHVKLSMELRKLLHAAVQTDNPAQYADMFTLHVRRKIHRILLKEIRDGYKAQSLIVGSSQLMIRGSAEFMGDDIYPAVTYYLYRTELTKDKKIRLRQVMISQLLADSMMAGDARFTTMPTFDDESRPFAKVKAQTYNDVNDWQEALVGEIGEEAARAATEREMNELQEDLFANVGSVYGQTRELEIQPTSGVYTYRYGRRILPGSVYNQTDEPYLQHTTQSPDDPSVDELEALMMLTF